jgi:hypothetical protein
VRPHRPQLHDSVLPAGHADCSEWRTQVGRGRRHLAPRPVRAPSTWARLGCRANTRLIARAQEQRRPLQRASVAPRRDDTGRASRLASSALRDLGHGLLCHGTTRESPTRLPARLLVARRAERMEMFVRSVREQTVRSTRTEISAKFAGGDRSLNSRRPASRCGAGGRTSQATSHFSSPRRSDSR